MAEVTADFEKRVEELMKTARPSLSREEIRQQRISFAYGLMGKERTMTREQVEELIDEQYGS